MAVRMEVDGTAYPIPHECVGDAGKIRSYLTSKGEGAPGLSKAQVDKLFEPPQAAEAETESGAEAAEEE